MDRLPVKFEDEVLKQYGIYWNPEGYNHIAYYEKQNDLMIITKQEMDEVMVSSNEIAFTGLKAILNNEDIDTDWIEENIYERWYQGRDYNNVVFKAIKEVWK